MTIIVGFLSVLVAFLKPYRSADSQAPRVFPAPAFCPDRHSRLSAPEASPSPLTAGELIACRAYQASPQGLIERHTYNLAVIIEALAGYAANPKTRPYVASEARHLAIIAARLWLILRLLARERQP
jgi:hypothetical protein